MKSFLYRPWGILFLNTIVVFIVGYLALNHDKFGMFYGGEGIANRIAIHDQFVWMPFGISVGMIPTVGAGIIDMPFNSLLMPAFLLQAIFHAGNIEAIPTYLFMALELFISVFVLGRALALKLPVCVLAAWVVLLLMTPFVRPNYLVYPVTHMVPLFGEIVAAACFGGAIFLSIGRFRAFGNVVLCGGWVMLIGWLIASDTTLFPLSVPSLAFFALAGIFGSRTRTECLWKLATILTAVVVLTLTGFPQSVIGSFRDTAINFFGPEFVNNSANDPIYISILFQGSAYSRVGPDLAILGLLGSAVLILFSDASTRRINLVLLGGITVLVGGLCVHGDNKL